MDAKLVMMGAMLLLAVGFATARVEVMKNNEATEYVVINKEGSNTPYILSSMGIDGQAPVCGGTACCNENMCTKSCPPQCRCRDVKEYCHAACKNCRCTRSIPPQCRCDDITNYDYPSCSEEVNVKLLRN